VSGLAVGIIGGGWIARRHVPAIIAARGVELVAVCDTELSRAQAIAGSSGARAYREWEEMLEREQLGAVWVCTPPLFHREPAVAAIERGMHVYLEKPIARTLADGEAIAAAAERSDVICAVGYQWHATELLDVVRDATRGQSIGLLTGRNYGPVAGRPWFVDRAQGGGQVLERGSHHIDLQRAIAGEIAAVEAVGAPVKLTGGQVQGNIDQVVSLTFHFRNGALGSVNIAWTHDGQPELYSLDVIGSDASLWLELGPDRFRVQGVAGGTELDDAYADPFDRSVSRFLEAVQARDRTRVFCSPADALRTLNVALACERALEGGQRVAVPELARNDAA
jgi:myo-inositol 2-dehydrogenase / D-chiro-inositol 1-dehydrogenase